MQKWEYIYLAYLRIPSPTASNTYSSSWFLNGKAHTLPLDLDFYQYLNQLGSQGWELIGFDDVGHAYMFKRPKP